MVEVGRGSCGGKPVEGEGYLALNTVLRLLFFLYAYLIFIVQKESVHIETETVFLNG